MSKKSDQNGSLWVLGFFLFFVSWGVTLGVMLPEENEECASLVGLGYAVVCLLLLLRLSFRFFFRGEIDPPGLIGAFIGVLLGVAVGGVGLAHLETGSMPAAHHYFISFLLTPFILVVFAFLGSLMEPLR